MIGIIEMQFTVRPLPFTVKSTVFNRFSSYFLQKMSLSFFTFFNQFRSHCRAQFINCLITDRVDPLCEI